MLRQALDIATKPVKETKLGDYDLLTIMIFTFAAWLMLQHIFSRVTPTTKRLKNNFPENFRKFALWAPYVTKIQRDLLDVENTIVELKRESDRVRSKWPKIEKFPAQPTPSDIILNSFEDLEKEYIWIQNTMLGVAIPGIYQRARVEFSPNAITFYPETPNVDIYAKTS